MIAISVVVCTRGRPAHLAAVLADLAAQEFDRSWEAVVVATDPVFETTDLLYRHQASFQLHACVEPQPGKSRALNRALDVASGSLIVFADDDVRLSPGWLHAYQRAATAHPPADIFAGPVRPDFSVDMPGWMRHSSFDSLAFGRFDPAQPEGPLRPPLLPVGANCAVRASIIGATRFRLDLGPSSGDATLYEDLAFFHACGCCSQTCVFVPAAAVSRPVEPGEIDLGYQFNRAFAAGCSIARIQRAVAVPAFLRMRTPVDLAARFFESGLLVNLLYGQLSELDRQGSLFQCELLRLVISTLEGARDSTLASDALTRWLADHPQYQSSGTNFGGPTSALPHAIDEAHRVCSGQLQSA